MRRRPLLATAVVVGASRGAARHEVGKQQAQQEADLNTQARLQWEAQQSAARDKQIADDAARAALAAQGQGQYYPQQQQGYPSQQQGYPQQQQGYPQQQQGYPQQGSPQQGYPQQVYAPQSQSPPNYSVGSGSGQPRFCAGCGHRLADGARFCQDCGTQAQA